jgi:hypothetical protein
MILTFITKLAKNFLVNSQRNLQLVTLRALNDRKEPIKKPELAACCGSGCQNCSWLTYADELLAYYEELNKKNEGVEKILQEIEKMEDANLKAFLKMEIQFKIK